MARDIIIGNDTRKQLSAGLSKLASVVSVTLGPRGSNVVIDRKYRTPIVTKDGFTAAKEIFLSEPHESMGCEIAKEAAFKLANSSGDGTTTTIMLADSIVRNSLSLFEIANPIEFINDMEEEVKKYCDFANEVSKTSVTTRDITQVGTISSNNDENIGSLLGKIYAETGHVRCAITKYGGTEDKLIINKGLEINRGWLLPHFSNNPKTMTWEAEDARVLICNQEVNDITELIPLMEHVNKTGIPLLIIVDSISGQALSTMVINSVKGTMNVCIVRSPLSEDKRSALLEDIAIVTGGQVISPQSGTSLLDFAQEGKRENFLGRAANIKVSRDTCLISGGMGDEHKIRDRIHQVSEISYTTVPSDRQFYLERVARLEGGTAEIKVGGETEVEMEQRRWRIEDAVCACRAAVDGGVVPGGGTLYHHYAYNRLKDVSISDGCKCLLESMLEPMYNIIQSCSYTRPEAVEIANSCAEKSDIKMRTTQGFDAMNNEITGMESSGIIEPTKVSTEVIKAALSVAKLILNSAAVVVPSTGKDDPINQIHHTANS